MLRCDHCGAPWRKKWQQCRFCQHDSPQEHDEGLVEPVKRRYPWEPRMKVSEMVAAGLIDANEMAKIFALPWMDDEDTVLRYAAPV